MPLRVKAVRSVKAVGFSTLMINILQVTQLIVLARLLDPADFGLMGMAFVFINFVTLLSDLGFGASLIQKQSISDIGISSLFWINILVGLVVFGTTWAGSPLIASWFSEPRLIPILHILGIIFLITPMGVIHGALLDKNMRFGEIAKIEMLASIIGVAVAIVTALAGGNIWALVSGFLTNSLVKALGYIAFGRSLWRPQFELNYHELKGHFLFGLPLALQRTINFVSANIDFFLVGKVLGSQVLGHYTMAYNLANLPSSKINPIAARVFFPLYSTVQNDDEKLRSGYLRMQEYSTLINTPILLGLAASAPIFVPLVLGAAWLPSVLLLQVLCFVGLTRSIGGTIGPLLLARGRSDLGFKWSLLIVFIQTPGIYIGLKMGGIIGLAIAFAVVQGVALILNYLVLVRTLLGPCLRDYVASILPGILMSLFMALIVASVPFALNEMCPLWLLFALQIVSGVFVYSLLLWQFNKPFVMTMRSMLLTKAV